jgi:hypothetical protein
MRYAILSGITVSNVIVADADFAVSVGAVACPDDVGIGWTYDGTNWAAPAPKPPPVPGVVFMRQARLALLQAGKLAAVDTAIAALPSPAKDRAQIEWEYATEVKRDSDLVAQLAPALNLDAAGLDALFTAAASL